MSAWIYIKSEPGLWTVGFYRPDGRFEPESDHESHTAAANHVHFLNGGSGISARPKVEQLVKRVLWAWEKREGILTLGDAEKAREVEAVLGGK